MAISFSPPAKRRFGKQLSTYICALVAGGSLSAAALGAGEVPGILFSGGASAPEKPPVEIDADLPRGAEIRFVSRPSTSFSACAANRPVCVHGPTTASVSAALEMLEAAWTGWVHVLNLPQPQSDHALGAGPELDWYLVEDPPTGFYLDSARALSDRGIGFCTSSPTQLDLHYATRCLAQAASYGMDAAETPALHEAYGAYAASLLAGPSASTREHIDAVQATPHVNPLGREHNEHSAAGALWLAYLDQAVARSAPGVLPTALFQLSHAFSVTNSTRWNNEPDSFDVLRRAFNEDPQRFAEFLSQFAIARAFLGDRDDGTHPPGLAWLEASGRVHFDWHLSYSTLPRNVASPRPLEPLGSSYVWLELDDVPLGARLAFRAQWEEPARFKWLVVSVDRDGREMKRWDVPYLEKGTQLEKTLMGFEGAAGLIFIAMNLDGVDVLHPYDPDFEPWEPHGYTLYITQLNTPSSQPSAP
ncbi:MAG: hypothetical protein RJA70_4127 [Pseudomonadota bacterium]|jgi:hypothetical protein